MKYKLGNSKVGYPVRGPIEEYPNYIEKDGKQLTLPMITKILNTKTKEKNKYDTIYDGDLNFITENGEKITSIDYILELLNSNDIEENTDEMDKIDEDIEKLVSAIIEQKEKIMKNRKWYIDYDNKQIHINIY